MGGVYHEVMEQTGMIQNTPGTIPYWLCQAEDLLAARLNHDITNPAQEQAIENMSREIGQRVEGTLAQLEKRWNISQRMSLSGLRFRIGMKAVEQAYAGEVEETHEGKPVMLEILYGHDVQTFLQYCSIRDLLETFSHSAILDLPGMREFLMQEHCAPKDYMAACGLFRASATARGNQTEKSP